MGLDGVEIVMDVEDHFGITIADEESSRIRTVGDLLALIESRCAKRVAGSCVSLPAFLQVRRLTRDLLAEPGLRLRPSTSIASAVPLSKRRDLWEQLSKLYGTAAPELCRPALIRYILFGTTCITFAAGLSTLVIDPAIIPAGLAAAAVTTFLLYFVTSPLRLIPPKRFETFGDIPEGVREFTLNR